MKLKVFVLSMMLAMTLAGCNEASNEAAIEESNETSSQAGASSSENETVNVKELVYNLSMRNITDQSAVILQDQLIVEEDGTETVYDLTKEDFFVSIAPYIHTTHP